jgi:hypothetical protein
MRAILLATLLGLSSLAAPAIAQAYTPGPHNITIPADYQTRFVRYAVVDKPDRKIIRHLYVNPEAFDALKKGEPSPDGTIIVMRDHAAKLDAAGNPMLDLQGRFIPLAPVLATAIQEKRKGWGVGYDDAKRNGEWEYARWDGAGNRAPASMDACFNCHKPLAAKDFNFTLWDYAQARR